MFCADLARADLVSVIHKNVHGDSLKDVKNMEKSAAQKAAQKKYEKSMGKAKKQ
jgi:hypothetical protein